MVGVGGVGGGEGSFRLLVDYRGGKQLVRCIVLKCLLYVLYFTWLLVWSCVPWVPFPAWYAQ
jgi:hypothetical protein